MSQSDGVVTAPDGDASPQAVPPLQEDRLADHQPVPSRTYSRKGLLAVALLGGLVVGMVVLGVHRAAGGRKADEDKVSRERPVAATGDPRQLAMPAWPASGSMAPVHVPAIEGAADAVAPGVVEPIEVRSTGARASGTGKLPPEDAPVLLVGTRAGAGGSAAGGALAGRPGAAGEDEDQDGGEGVVRKDALAATTRNLQAYQRQLQGTLDQLARSTESAAPVSVAAPAAAVSGLFGGALAGSSTPRVTARTLGDPSLTLPKGTAFSCALKTRVVSATSGLIGCQVQRHVYSADGRVVLVERGSHVDGEYRMTSVRPGVVRIPVLWTRIRTPLGVVVDLESPATGPLGESGIEGFVDNRWGERLGAAMLLSLIDDAVKLAVQEQSQGQAGTVVLPSTTSGTSKLAEKVLDSTVNLPPLIYRNQGGIVGVHVARDVDFSTVYALLPAPDLEVR